MSVPLHVEHRDAMWLAVKVRRSRRSAAGLPFGERDQIAHRLHGKDGLATRTLGTTRAAQSAQLLARSKPLFIRAGLMVLATVATNRVRPSFGARPPSPPACCCCWTILDNDRLAGRPPGA